MDFFLPHGGGGKIRFSADRELFDAERDLCR